MYSYTAWTETRTHTSLVARLLFCLFHPDAGSGTYGFTPGSSLYASKSVAFCTAVKRHSSSPPPPPPPPPVPLPFSPTLAPPPPPFAFRPAFFWCPPTFLVIEGKVSIRRQRGANINANANARGGGGDRRGHRGGGTAAAERGGPKA